MPTALVSRYESKGLSQQRHTAPHQHDATTNANDEMRFEIVVVGSGFA